MIELDYEEVLKYSFGELVDNDVCHTKRHGYKGRGRPTQIRVFRDPDVGKRWAESLGPGWFAKLWRRDIRVVGVRLQTFVVAIWPEDGRRV